MAVVGPGSSPRSSSSSSSLLSLLLTPQSPGSTATCCSHSLHSHSAPHTHPSPPSQLQVSLLLLAQLAAHTSPSPPLPSLTAHSAPPPAAGNATATATSLLSVPAYATQTSGPFATASAKALASSLPGYRYNLTQEVRPSPLCSLYVPPWCTADSLLSYPSPSPATPATTLHPHFYPCLARAPRPAPRSATRPPPTARPQAARDRAPSPTTCAPSLPPSLLLLAPLLSARTADSPPHRPQLQPGHDGLELQVLKGLGQPPAGPRRPRQHVRCARTPSSPSASTP